MSRIRSKNTLPERMLGEALTRLGLTWEGHANDLPGRPDFVFREKQVIVFVDGDFWHGWRFPQWKDKLSVDWEEKIAKNRARDQRNHSRLRRSGWQVLRIWEHQIHGNLEQAVGRVLVALGITA